MHNARLLIAVVIVLMTCPLPAGAMTVRFPVDAGLIGTTITSDVDLFSSDLNDIVVNGQILALDLVFDQSNLARMTFGDIGVGLTIYTTTDGFPPPAGATSGFLLSPGGGALHAAAAAGQALADDGSFTLGLVDLGSLMSGVIDISGAHFDLSMPDNDSTIINARLRISMNSAFSQVRFGTAAQLPEPATAVLLTLGGVAVLGVRRWLVSGRSD